MAGDKAGLRLGVEMDWRLMGTGPAIMQAFQRGELDLAYIGLPPAIIGIDQGIQVVCVAGGHMEGTVLAGKAQWKAFPEEDLGSVLRQFRGKQIGVPGKGSIHDVILKDCLDRYGLESEVKIANYPWSDLIIEAVVKDEVSAAMGTPALAAAIRRYAKGKVLVPPSHLWPDNPSYGIIAAGDFLAKHPNVVEQFLALHEEATALLRKQPGAAAEHIADFVGIVDRALVLDAISISPKYCAQLSEAYISSTIRFLPVLRKLGYIKDSISQDRIFFRDLINKVHPEKDHYCFTSA
jgi:NitT/TauT family transport system substrate-binding protein